MLTVMLETGKEVMAKREANKGSPFDNVSS